MTLALAVAVAALALLPLGYIAWYTADLGWAGVRELVLRPRVGELLWNTTRLVVGTVVCCAVLGRRCGLAGRALLGARPAGSGTCCWSRRWRCRRS